MINKFNLEHQLSSSINLAIHEGDRALLVVERVHAHCSSVRVR